MRRGFTLIELLVASGVFLFGFTAALGLFLIGTRARAQADGMLRLSLAASSIVEEIRLEAGRETPPPGQPQPPFAPQAYIGDGFAAVASSVDDGSGNMLAENETAYDKVSLYPYRPQPGIWYRVIDCVDEKGDQGNEVPSRGAELATALRLDLLIVWNPVADETLTIKQLAERQGLHRPKSPILPWPSVDFTKDLADFMAKRGFAVREAAWIIRKPSWER